MIFDCFIKVRVNGRDEPCGRARAREIDLCCAEHWRLVPRELKRKLIDAQDNRSLKENQRLTINAASEIVEYIKALKIQLPPVQKIQKPDAVQGSARVGSLVKVESGPVVQKTGKLIIP